MLTTTVVTKGIQLKGLGLRVCGIRALLVLNWSLASKPKKAQAQKRSPSRAVQSGRRAKAFRCYCDLLGS